MTAVWWKTSPSTEPRSITARSSSPSRSRRACSSAWIVGGTVSAPPPSSRTIATISSTNSGFPSADVRMRRADVGVEGDAVEQVVEELVDVPLRQRLEQDRGGVRLAAAPHRPCVEQLRARDAEQEDRPVARPVRHVLDDVEERLLRPLEIVEDDDERLLRGGALQQAAERELRLGRRRAEDRVRVGAELKNDLHERPVGDALAVGEAAGANGARVDRLDEVEHEARLADAGGAEQGEELARAFGDHVLEVGVEPLALSASADER